MPACCVLSYNGKSLEVPSTHPPPDIHIQLVVSLQTEEQHREDKGSDSVLETTLASGLTPKLEMTDLLVVCSNLFFPSGVEAL